jgi:CHAT domain-containing protein/Tfp pilus assembly protein PilF
MIRPWLFLLVWFVLGENPMANLPQSMEDRGDNNGTITTLNNMGAAYHSQGLYGQAIECYQRALRMAEELADQRVMAETLYHLGVVYAEQGSHGRATEYYQRALRIAQDLGDKRVMAQTLGKIGNLYRMRGLYGEAIDHYRRALRTAQDLRDQSEVALVLKDIGVVYLSAGWYDRAVEYLQKALQIGQEIEAKATSAYALKGIGRAYLKLQKYPEAVEALQQALALGEEIRKSEIVWLARYNLAGVYEKTGQPALALKQYQLAIEEIEKARAGASSDEGKADFFQNQAYVYKKACALLLTLHEKDPARGYDQQAIAYAERARARAFVDLLAEGLVGLNKRVSPGVQEKERNVLARLSRANQKLQSQGRSPEREALMEEIRQLEIEHDQLKEEVQRQDPAYANLAYPQPYTLEQIRENVLDEETALLEYLLDDEQSLVYLISRKELVIQRLPGRSRIKEKVTTFLDAVKLTQSESAATAALQTISQDLYRALIAPIAPNLRRYRNLIIAGDNLLYYLPFEALGSAGPGGFRYLIEDHVISYTPSATVLGELRRRPHRDKPEALLALGDPDFGKREQTAQSLIPTGAVRGLYDTQFTLDRLPNTGEEVQEIARYFPRKDIRVRRAASEEFIKQAALENYRVIHFATHGLLDERSPKASCIVLSLDEQGREDGFLQVREIYNLKLDADLVVLSACNTGRGRLVNGEGVLGLNRAFFYAGARSVLGSLWSVNDRASADFMNQFYYHLQQGQGKAEALRAAKLKFLKSATHAHPYYWAAFILQGEPKEKVFSETSWVRWLLFCLAALFIPLTLWRFLKARPAST